ncbi:delta(3,5)-Delta(2,4)-dienoyl-CoA isomerase, mitochondrial [Galendromus occidentalis]|uniref:Delta(3,5)-Delta(2,4)-dienoyl-CoA isomerase, mitochondrial n=1 Tax=Galendromus occidentalis TaxID=34638 RepID=A0AAJ6QQG8_9ACAR|nr:delta(3,5)-Delta(2,4)-dienoyl-CoA isomerase, mitochondrial [Galendromus occidentalis]
MASLLVRAPAALRSGIQKMSLRAASTDFKTLKVHKPAPFVYNVELNRPDKRNAMNGAMWDEIPRCFTEISQDPDCRVVVLSGAGAMFTAGLDLAEQAAVLMSFNDESDPSRKFVKLRDIVARYQFTFTAIEKCPKPVIAAVHSACIGAGTSLITACDIRYCSEDAWFSIKEVNVGICADVGVLQRIHRVVGNGSVINEWALTGRKFDSKEALREGLVSRVLKDRDELMKASLDMAKLIASQSPVAVQGTKVNLAYSRSHSVDESLDYQAIWNACNLQTEDLTTAAAAIISKDPEPPVFSKL